MRYIHSLLLLTPAALGHVFKRAACNANDCARAVTGSKGNSASRVSTDCSSFQRVTSCPSATTVTVTSGPTAGTKYPSSCADTTIITPTSVPPYAQTACSSGGSTSSRFSSACSCASVTRTTITAPQPTVTVYMAQSGVQSSTCLEVAANGAYVSNGRTFYANCNQNVYCSPDASAVASSFADCVNKCAQRGTCYIAIFNRAALAGDNCQFCSGYDDAAFYDAAHDFGSAF